MKYILTSILLLLLFTIKTNACSFAPGYFQFKATPDSFELKMDKGRIALLPAPEIKIDKVVRGSAPPGSSCADAGMIYLTVTWPEDSPYKLAEIGFFFQSDNGLEPDLIFPLTPVTGKITDNKAKFFFVWLDGHPKYQKELNFKINVFAVNKGLQIGLPATVNLNAKKG